MVHVQNVCVCTILSVVQCRYNITVWLLLRMQGVESEHCASFQAAMQAGHPVKIEANQAMTLADGRLCYIC